MTAEAAERVDSPDAEHPVLELTYEVRTTHRVRIDAARAADEFASWFQLDYDPTPDQIHELLVETRHFPTMFEDALIEMGGDHNGIGWEFDDGTIQIKWMQRRAL
jgi:hypothetical protein